MTPPETDVTRRRFLTTGAVSIGAVGLGASVGMPGIAFRRWRMRQRRPARRTPTRP